MSLTLSTDEIVELSGYVQKKKQIESLGLMGFRYWVNGRGQVIVLRRDVESDHEREEQPDFDAI